MDEKTREDAINLKIMLLQEKSRTIEMRHKLAEEDKRMAEKRGHAVNLQQPVSSRSSKGYRSSRAHMDNPYEEEDDQDDYKQAPEQSRRQRGSRDFEEQGQGDFHHNEQQDREYRGGQNRNYRQQSGGGRQDGRFRNQREPQHQRYPDRPRGGDRNEGYDGRRQRDDRRTGGYGQQDSRKVDYGGYRRQRDDREYGKEEDIRNRELQKNPRASERERQRLQNVEMMNKQMSGELQKGDKDWQEPGGFLKDPRRDGEGEFQKHPPPRSVQYNPAQGRQQRNYGNQMGDRMIDMTGRQRQEYDRWKVQQDLADKERLARSQAAGGEWRRDWDVEKKAEDFDEDTRDRRQHHRGGRRGGRFDRADNRQERDSYRSGDRPPRRQHDEGDQDRRDNRRSSRDNDYNQPPANRSNYNRNAQRPHEAGGPDDDRRQNRQRKSSSNELDETADENLGANPSEARPRDNDRPQKNRQDQSETARPKTGSFKDDDEWGQEAEHAWGAEQGAHQNKSQSEDRKPFQEGTRDNKPDSRRVHGHRRDDQGRQRYGNSQEDQRQGPRHRQNDWEERQGGNQRRGQDQNRGDWGHKRRDQDQNHGDWNQKRRDQGQRNDRWNQRPNTQNDDRPPRRGQEPTGEGLGSQRNERDARATIEERRRDNQGQRSDNKDHPRGYQQNQNRGQRKTSENKSSNERNEQPQGSNVTVKSSTPKDEWGNNAEDDWGNDAGESWGTEDSPAVPAQAPPTQEEDDFEDFNADKSNQGATVTEDEKLPEESFEKSRDEESSFDLQTESSDVALPTSEDTEHLEQTDKQKLSKNRGNLKVRIDPKETKTDSDRNDTKRSTSLTSPLKTPENFVPIGDWALEVEMSSPTYDSSKTPPTLDNDTVKNETESVKQGPPQDGEPELDTEDTSNVEIPDSVKPNDDQVSNVEKTENQTDPAQPTSYDISVSNPFLITKETSAESEDVPFDKEVIAGFGDNFSELTPADIGLQPLHSEQEGLLSGQDKDVPPPQDNEESDKEVYEDVQDEEQEVASGSDDDNDSFATAGSEEKDVIGYQKLDESSSEDELATADTSLQDNIEVEESNENISNDVDSETTQKQASADEAHLPNTSDSIPLTPDEISKVDEENLGLHEEVAPDQIPTPDEDNLCPDEEPESSKAPDLSSATPNKEQADTLKQDFPEQETVDEFPSDRGEDSAHEDELSGTESQNAEFEQENRVVVKDAEASLVDEAPVSSEEHLEAAAFSEQSSQNELLPDDLDSAQKIESSEVETLEKNCLEPVQTNTQSAETGTSQTCATEIIDSAESKSVNENNSEENNSENSFSQNAEDRGHEEESTESAAVAIEDEQTEVS